jgi:hypothetical protein
MAAYAIDAVSASLQERRYEQLSRILDACELEVRTDEKGCCNDANQ